MLGLAKKIIKLTDSKSKIIYKPYIELAKKELKWKPKIQLDEGLKKTINYFERLLNNEK